MSKIIGLLASSISLLIDRQSYSQERWDKAERHRVIEEENWKRQSRTSWLAILISGGGVILNLLGLLFIYKSLITSQEAANAARAAANAAQSQASVAMDTEKRQLRAYALMTGGQLTNFAENGVGRVDGVIENMGQTPVFEGHLTSGINIVDTSVTGKTQYSECDVIAREGASTWFFGKAANPHKVRATSFTPDDINSVKAGTKKVVFSGRFCYKDIFTEQHHTDFCFQWSWDAKNNSLESATGYCAEGNGST